MPLVVFVPSSPLLVAGADVGDVPETSDVRRAARDALRAVVAARPDRVVVLGGPLGDDSTGADAQGLDESAGGTLRPHGLGVDAGGPRHVLGLAHTVGARLLDDAGWAGPRRYTAAPTTLGDGDAVLVVADGSARRSDRAPGHLDERAEPFDAVLLAALGDGDPDVLGGVADDLAADVWCVTAPTWRAAGDLVAGRLARTDAADAPADARGGAPDARVRYAGAPLGVGWFVADWVVA